LRQFNLSQTENLYLKTGTETEAVTDSVILRSVRETLDEAVSQVQASPRPAVTLSYAQSLDGCISAGKGAPTAISGDQSLVMTHKLRAMHDAILVGINTVLIDNPSLTVRHVEGESPIPVILDSHLRIPAEAKLLHLNGKQVIIATLPGASKEREMELVEAGARVVRIPEASGGGIKLTELFRWLRESHVNSLMIEGGAKVISSVLAERLGDQLVLTIAPKFFGRNGVNAVEDLNCVRPTSIPCLAHVEYERLGDDMLVWGRPVAMAT
jgi:3,4-dihydroxy 2-butanone 4-phosphate synthase/GTP cyclohydrolase II